MPINIRCKCGCSYRVPETAVGKTFRCKKCNAANSVTRPRTSENSEATAESDANNPLNQLFDDDEQIDSTVTPKRPGHSPTQGDPPSAESPPPADVRPILWRRKQTPDAPEHRPVHPSFSELGPVSITLLAAITLIAIAYLHPPLARVILQIVFFAGALIAIVSYVLGTLMTPEKEPIYTLISLVFPLVFIAYAFNHLDEAAGALVFIGVGIVLMLTSTFLASSLLPEAGNFPF